VAPRVATTSVFMSLPLRRPKLNGGGAYVGRRRKMPERSARRLVMALRHFHLVFRPSNHPEGRLGRPN
jgi:hypothetical protein